jgi:hypothetical protein
VINHSQQPRKPTENSMFSQIRTRARHITARPSGAAPEGPPDGHRRAAYQYASSRIEEYAPLARAARSMWALEQLCPQTHHPDQPAAHTAFQLPNTLWARLVWQYGPSTAPFARVRLWASIFWFLPLPRPYASPVPRPQAGQRADYTRAGFRVSDLAVAELLHSIRIGRT